MEFGVIDETDDSMHYLGPRGTKKKKKDEQVMIGNFCLPADLTLIDISVMLCYFT